MKSSESAWNSLEAAKLAASLGTPVVVAVLGFYLADIQQAANKKASIAAEKRATEAREAQDVQAQQFQQGLAASNQALSRQLQQADLKSRAEFQAPSYAGGNCCKMKARDDPRKRKEPNYAGPRK
jgi:hypothetical protein